MIDFIVKNYQFIALVVAALVDVVLLVVAVCRKNVNPTLEKVITMLPEFIVAEEKRAPIGCGVEKKARVMSLAIAFYKHLTGEKVEEGSRVYSTISRAIESILETPQKKER